MEGVESLGRGVYSHGRECAVRRELPGYVYDDS